MRGRGFTLIELVLVLLVLAILSSAVVVRLHSPARNAQWEDLLSAVGDYDAMTRARARQQDGAMRLIVDLSGGRLYRAAPDETKPSGAVLAIRDGRRIERIRLGEETVRRGEVAIACSPQGLTPTYAIRLVDDQGRQAWLLTAGLTGQVTVFNDDETFEQTWQTLFGDDAG